jgi:hypothetical protein
MKFLLKIILIFAVMLSQSLFSRTRQQVIDEANIYKNYPWTVGANNILDTKKYNITTGQWEEGIPDGIDDRMGPIIRNADKTTNWAAMRANWPFQVNTTYTGEAYAFGGWSGSKVFGYDTTNEFSLKIKSLSPYSGEKWIAGSKEEEMGTGPNKDTIIPTGYAGFAGIDCSGFVSRCLNLKEKKNTTGLTNICVKINTLKDLKQGDIIDRVPKHVVIFSNWANEENTKAYIIHAGTYNFENGDTIYRVEKNVISIRERDGKIEILDPVVSKNLPYQPMTPFPYFCENIPAKDGWIEETRPKIRLKIKGTTENKIVANSIKMRIDDGEIFVPSLSSSVDSAVIIVSNFVNNELTEGSHTIWISASNTIELREDITNRFNIDVPAFPYIEWIIFEQGTNKMRYVWERKSITERELKRYVWASPGKGKAKEWIDCTDNPKLIFSFNTNEDARIEIHFSHFIEKEKIPPTIRFLDKDKEQIIGMKWEKDLSGGYKETNDCISMESVKMAENGSYDTNWYCVIKRTDLARNKEKLTEIAYLSIEAYEYDIDNSTSGTAIDNDPGSVVHVYGGGPDKTIPVRYKYKIEKPDVLLEAKDSYELRKKEIGGEKVYLIKDRYVKVKLMYTNEIVNIYKPAYVNIGGKVAVPLTNEGYINGWTNTTSTNPIWVGIIDFGENWQNMSNKSYPVIIQCEDFAANKTYDTNRDIIYDTKNPTFQFLNELSKLSFNILDETDLGKFSFKLWDNLSEKLKVHLALKKEDGNELIGLDFYLQIRPNFTIQPISANVSDFIEIDSNGNLSFKWNGKDIIGNLQTSLQNPQIQVVIEDEAGNVFNSSEFHFDLKQIIPEPEELLQATLQYIKDKAGKIIFVDSSMLPTWAWEIVQDKLSKEGIDFRVCQLKGGEKFEDLEKQVGEVKKTVDDFVRGNEKCIVFGFGSGGVAAKEYIRRYYNDGKVMKFVSFSMPNFGINSFAQTPQSYAIYLCLSPLLSWISSIDFLKDLLNMIKTDGNLGFMDMIQKTCRNDYNINPFNFIGPLLGKTEGMLQMQNLSEEINKIKDFNPKEVGIETEAIKTALWPDMPAELQAAVVAGVAALGYAGVYQNVQLFSFDSKVFNNLESEVANFVVDLVSEQIDNYIFLPIWQRVEREYSSFAGKIDLSLFKKEIKDIVPYGDEMRSLKKEFIAKLRAYDGNNLTAYRDITNYINTKLGDVAEFAINKIVYIDRGLTEFSNWIAAYIMNPVNKVSVVCRKAEEIVTITYPESETLLNLIRENKPKWLKEFAGNALDEPIADLAKMGIRYVIEKTGAGDLQTQVADLQEKKFQII